MQMRVALRLESEALTHRGPSIRAALSGMGHVVVARLEDADCLITDRADRAEDLAPIMVLRVDEASSPSVELRVERALAVLHELAHAASAGPSPAATPAGAQLRLGPIALDLDQGRVQRPEGETRLTAIEVAVVRRLLAERGAFVSKKTLEREVWRYAEGTRSRTVLSTMHRLRAKIEPDPEAPRFLVTDRQRGYRLSLPGRLALTRPLGPFVGRDPELALAMERLGTARLLTLTGPGGVGKTRLARELGHLLSRTTEVLWCDCAALEDARALLTVIATTLGSRASEDKLESALTMAFGDRATLVVLDDLDLGVAAARDLVPRLLARWPRHVRILATSREALDLPFEERLPLLGLDPALATRLFVARAEAPDRSVDPSSPEVSELVQRCDGLPLALELAARLAHHLPLGLIAPGIALHLRSIRMGETPRHESLAAALDLSWNLLGEGARELLARLSALPGPIGEELALGLATLQSEGAKLLAELERKSLVTRDDDCDPPRYRVLSIVRDHALERLPAERRATLRWLTTWAERLEVQAEGPLDALGVALRTYRNEGGNLRAAARLATAIDPSLASRLLPALMPLWVSAGPLTEALDLMRAVPDDVATPELRFRRAQTAALIGNTPDAIAALEALTAADPTHARAHDLLATLLPDGPARAAARREADRLFGETSLGRAERLESEAAECSQAGLIEEALTLTEAALELYRELGRGRRALALTINRGSHLRDLGAPEAARVLAEAVADAEASTFELAVLYARYNLAFLEADQGRLAAAARELEHVSQLGRRQGSLGVAARAEVWRALLEPTDAERGPALERALSFAREVDDPEAATLALAALERRAGRVTPTDTLARALADLAPMARAHTLALAPSGAPGVAASPVGPERSALVRIARGVVLRT